VKKPVKKPVRKSGTAIKPVETKEVALTPEAYEPASADVGLPWVRGEIDQQNLLRIENAWSGGASTWREVAELTGMNYESLRNAMFLPQERTAPWQETRRQAIQAAYEKGIARRSENVKSLAETSLLKLLNGYTTKSTTTEKRMVAGRETVFKRITENEVPPSITAVIFSLCNIDPLRWRSVNKQSEGEGSGGGAILDWIRDQAREGRNNEGRYRAEGQPVSEAVYEEAAG
jgi:hypothetical protein